MNQIEALSAWLDALHDSELESALAALDLVTERAWLRCQKIQLERGKPKLQTDTPKPPERRETPATGDLMDTEAVAKELHCSVFTVRRLYVELKMIRVRGRVRFDPRNVAEFKRKGGVKK